jgi:hypothetical protein
MDFLMTSVRLALSGLPALAKADPDSSYKTTCRQASQPLTPLLLCSRCQQASKTCECLAYWNARDANWDAAPLITRLRAARSYREISQYRVLNLSASAVSGSELSVALRTMSLNHERYDNVRCPLTN